MDGELGSQCSRADEATDECPARIAEKAGHIRNPHQPKWTLIMRFTKRALDLGIAVVAILISLPIVLLSSVLIVLEDGRPIFFVQSRVGKDGAPFRLLKLRSMRANDVPSAEMVQIECFHPLTTNVGRLLRRLKIDELPQFYNVLRGELSVVGPRPTIIEQVNQYSGFQRRRLEIRPGLTGWAQVNGNVTLPWETRIALDVWYIDHRSLVLDVVILIKTLATVMFGERPNPKAVLEARKYADGSSWCS
jgi:lipopolysaccharide/colanic/teichoic acid biosynthesis glycosyltransferase